jgi:hypothetical protein
MTGSHDGMNYDRVVSTIEQGFRNLDLSFFFRRYGYVIDNDAGVDPHPLPPLARPDVLAHLCHGAQI